jgi:hypothetical protein
MYLKKCEVVLNERITKQQGQIREQTVNSDYIELTKMFLLQGELCQILQSFYPDAWSVYEQEKQAMFIDFANKRSSASLADLNAFSQSQPSLELSLDLFTLPYVS